MLGLDDLSLTPLAYLLRALTTDYNVICKHHGPSMILYTVQEYCGFKQQRCINAVVTWPICLCWALLKPVFSKYLVVVILTGYNIIQKKKNNLLKDVTNLPDRCWNISSPAVLELTTHILITINRLFEAPKWSSWILTPCTTVLNNNYKAEIKF